MTGHDYDTKKKEKNKTNRIPGCKLENHTDSRLPHIHSSCCTSLLCAGVVKLCPCLRCREEAGCRTEQEPPSGHDLHPSLSVRRTLAGRFSPSPPCDSITVRTAAASPSVNPHYHHHPLQLLLSLAHPLSLSSCMRAKVSVFVCVCTQEDEEAVRRRHQGRPFLSSPGSLEMHGTRPS